MKTNPRALRRAVGLIPIGILFFAGAAAALGLRMAERPESEGTCRLESAMSVGGPDAGDDAFFYERFGSVHVDADDDGNFYVLDNGNVRVQVFDSRGAFLRSLGAEGEGPGEFQFMSRFSVNGDGDVAVLDEGQGRVTVLAADGSLRYDVIVAPGVEDVALRDDGTVLVSYGDVGPALVRAYGPDGEILWSSGENAPPGGRMVKMDLPRQTIAPRLAVLSSGGCVRTPRGEYRIETYGEAGAAAAAFARAFERREISSDEMLPSPEDGDEGGEPAVIMVRHEVAGGGAGDGDAGSRVRSFSPGDGEEEIHIDLDDLSQFMPKFHPDTRGVLVWPDGRLWIVTAKDRDGGAVTDEWTTDGTWRRRFTLPGEYDRLRVGRDGNLYGVHHDGDDYPTVHRLAVVISHGGGEA
jgi:hypothetical protein